MLNNVQKIFIKYLKFVFEQYKCLFDSFNAFQMICLFVKDYFYLINALRRFISRNFMPQFILLYMPRNCNITQKLTKNAKRFYCLNRKIKHFIEMFILFE